MSQPKHTISLMVDDAPLYVESESEVNENDVAVMDNLMKKIKAEWKDVIKPCNVLLQRLTASGVGRLQRQFKKESICVPLAPPDSQIEVISETDLEMFPEDSESCDSASEFLLKYNEFKKSTSYVETVVQTKDKEDNKRAETLDSKHDAFNTSTEIDSKNGVSSFINALTDINAANEVPGSTVYSSESENKSVVSAERKKDQVVQEDADCDDLVDASQSLFDEVQNEETEIPETQNIKNDWKNAEHETYIKKDSEKLNTEENIAIIITSDVEENSNKIEEEPVRNKSNDNDEDELSMSLRLDSDSEPDEPDVMNLLSNSGEDETGVVDGDIVNDNNTKRREAGHEQQGIENENGQFNGPKQKKESLADKAKVGQPGDSLVMTESSAATESTNDIFEAPDSPIMDLLPDKSDSEPDEEEWVHKSTMESAVEDSDLTALDNDSEIAETAEDESEEEQKEIMSSRPSSANFVGKEDQPEFTGNRRSLRQGARLSLSGKKKTRSQEMKLSEPATQSEPSRRITRSSPITVAPVKKARRSTRNSPDAEKQDKEDIKSGKKTLTNSQEKNKDGIGAKETEEKKKETALDTKAEHDDDDDDDDDKFTIPLSQKSNGFTIETKLICDDEVNLIEEDTNDDDGITLSQMPILIESSDDDESTVKSECEQILSDSEYHSLFVVDSDEEEANVDVKRERRSSGYDSDLEIIGEEKTTCVKVKEEKENEAKTDLKLPHADAELQSTSPPDETDGDGVDNAVTEGSVSGGVSGNDAKQIYLGKETDNQKELVDTGTDSVVSKNDQISTETFVKHRVDLSEMADDEVKKFLDGAFHSQTSTKTNNETTEGDYCEDSSDDESFEDLEGDYLYRKELEKKKLVEEQTKKDLQTRKQETLDIDSSDDSDGEDLEGDFLSRKEKEKKLQQDLEKTEKLSKSDTKTDGEDKAEDKSKGDDLIAVKERVEDVSTTSDEHESLCDVENNVAEAADEDSENEEVTFKPGTPKMNAFKEFESSPEETLPDIPAPDVTRSKIRKRILSEDSDSDKEEFVSIPSTSFYKKDNNQKSLRLRGVSLKPQGQIKKPVARMTNEDLWKAQRLRAGRGRGVKTSFEIHSHQIARARAQMNQRRMQNKNKGEKNTHAFQGIHFLFVGLRYPPI